MGARYQGRKLLAVLAHPDDESFGMGGTLAYYAEKGVEVHLVCATHGEAGEVGPDYLEGHESIADLREAELKCAAVHLGIEQIYFLDYRDSGMLGSTDNKHPRALVSAPQEKVVREITEIIRKFRPEVVITFDPIGGYRHPDHVFIHEVAKKAFFQAGDPDYETESNPFQPEKLYYHTISKRYLRIVVCLLGLLGQDPTKWGKNDDIDLAALAEEEFPVHARIDVRSMEERKKAASACHASQSGSSLVGDFFRWVLKMLGFRGKDLYIRAHPGPQEGEVENDLYAGM